MTLNPGTITGLLGKNGAGKTSLLKLLAGLLYPGSGTMDVIGHQSSKRQPSFLSQVFYVPEDFCLPSISIKNFIRANSPFYPKFDSQLMDELLEEFELTSDSSIKALSYGQKKEVSYFVRVGNQMQATDFGRAVQRSGYTFQVALQESDGRHVRRRPTGDHIHPSG